MKSKEILQRIRFLEKEVESLSKEIESLKDLSHAFPLAEEMLKQRGITIFRKDPIDRLFIPADLSDENKSRFYGMMKRYSFRLVLRDMIKLQERFRVEDLTHYCSSTVAKRYCMLLSDMGLIVKVARGIYRPRVFPIYSFGSTLEWFVAEVFRREFSSPAIYGVSVKKIPSGGDYDVIASWNRRLVYVEVKSSPPKGIELNEVSTFFSRIAELLPDVAIFFNDTQLRMKDKLVVLFEEELGKRFREVPRSSYPVERLIGELFHLKHRIFIVNSKKDIVENLKICLKDYLRKYGNGILL